MPVTIDPFDFDVTRSTDSEELMLSALSQSYLLANYRSVSKSHMVLTSAAIAHGCTPTHTGTSYCNCRWSCRHCCQSNAAGEGRSDRTSVLYSTGWPTYVCLSVRESQDSSGAPLEWLRTRCATMKIRHARDSSRKMYFMSIWWLQI